MIFDYVKDAAVSMLNGATADEVRDGLQNFMGVLRRFDIQLQSEKK